MCLHSSGLDICPSLHLQCNATGRILYGASIDHAIVGGSCCQTRTLGETAKRKRSEVVREALEQYLDTQPDIRPIERVRDLLGSIASGRPT